MVSEWQWHRLVHMLKLIETENSQSIKALSSSPMLASSNTEV